MKRDHCPTPLSLSAALSQGERSPLYEHISNCPSCSADAKLAALGRELPRYTPSKEQKERALSALIAQAQLMPPAQSSGRALWWAIPIAASLALGIFLWPKRQIEAELSTKITAQSTAQFNASTQGKYEAITLHSGALHLNATKLGDGETLRLSTKDATIETLYSVFTVAAYEGRLIQVDVTEGQLTLQLLPTDKVKLQAGDHWEPTKPTTTVALSTTKEITKKQPTTPEEPKKTKEEPLSNPTEAKPREVDQAEIDYQEGVSALKDGRFNLAVERFSSVISSAKEPSLIEDASYWNAVSLLRAGRDQEAKAALKSFIEKYPNASRAGESRVALGSLLLESGDLDGAERLFHAAIEDRSAAVRDSAKKGLEAISAQRPK